MAGDPFRSLVLGTQPFFADPVFDAAHPVEAGLPVKFFNSTEGGGSNTS